MLGFSVYLGHDLTSENYNYLLTMRNSGFTCVFTQLAVPDTDSATILKRLGDLTNWCQKLDLKIDRKSTRLNSSHVSISYAVFCLKKKKQKKQQRSNATKETSEIQD